MGFFAALPLIMGGVSAAQQQQAAQKAAQSIEDVAKQNVDFIAEMGAKGVDEITKSLTTALSYDPTIAAKYIEPYADIGGQAFAQAKADILAGTGQTPYTQAVSQAAGEAVGEAVRNSKT
jgi:hypothetical protein